MFSTVRQVFTCRTLASLGRLTLTVALCRVTTLNIFFFKMLLLKKVSKAKLTLE